MHCAVVRGTGSIGMRHLRILSQLGVRPLACPVRAERRGTAELAEFETTASLAEAARRGANVAVIASDTRNHVNDALEALAAELHVLVEKPVASDLSELAPLAKAARQTSKKVYVASPLRFHEGLTRFRAALGGLGRLDSVRIVCQSFLPDWRPGTDHRTGYAARAVDGGVLRDLIHEIDYALWIFGRPDKVFCMTGNEGRIGIDSEESADVLWKLANGAVVSLRLDYVTRPARRSVVAFGEGGVLELDLLEHRVTLARTVEAPVTSLGAQDRDEMMKAQALSFLAGASGESAGPLSTLEEGARALSVCDAARASAKSGRLEDLCVYEGP